MLILYIVGISIPFLLVAAFFLTERGKHIQSYVHFFAMGLEKGFTPRQILLLGKIADATGLEDPASLFWSISALDRCTAEIVRQAKRVGTETDFNTQKLLSGLYGYRTTIALEEAHKKRGLESTKDIVVGQRVRVLLRGVGVFTSKVLKVTPRHLALDYPSNPKIPAASINWVGQSISVYLWRHDDAGYVFDTAVLPDPDIANRAVIHVAHTSSLVRTQKRKSIRAKCSIYAQLYLFHPGEEPDSAIEAEPGMKCLLEDISEDGARFVIGGRAAKDIQIKLQFMLHDVLIVMTGISRGVEFNPDTNQSRVHFECGELNPRMKNAILSFVYNVLPEEEKDQLDAMRLAEEDSQAAGPDAVSSVGGTEVGRDVPDFLEQDPK